MWRQEWAAVNKAVAALMRVPAVSADFDRLISSGRLIHVASQYIGPTAVVHQTRHEQCDGITVTQHISSNNSTVAAAVQQQQYSSSSTAAAVQQQQYSSSSTAAAAAATEHCRQSRGDPQAIKPALLLA